MDFPSYDNWRLWEKAWHKAFYHVKKKDDTPYQGWLEKRSAAYTEQHDNLKEMNQ